MLQNLLVIVLSTYVVLATLAQETTQDGFDARKCFQTLRKLHTTRSWDFLGLPIKLKKRNAQIQSNIIVGVLDTGIYLDGPNFNDTGYGPPPSKWKGKCVKGDNFTGCNNKVIGAKYFNLDPNHPLSGKLSPVDDEGHVTHTDSPLLVYPSKEPVYTALRKGQHAVVRPPLSRIAVYKVCWPFTGCSYINILAAFDEAVADGVDWIAISMRSLGEYLGRSYCHWIISCHEKKDFCFMLSWK